MQIGFHDFLIGIIRKFQNLFKYEIEVEKLNESWNIKWNLKAGGLQKKRAY